MKLSTTLSRRNRQVIIGPFHIELPSLQISSNFPNYLLIHLQGLDIHWRDHYICPTVEEYIDMVLKKTGGLMMLAFDLMFIFRNQSGKSALSMSDVVFIDCNLASSIWEQVLCLIYRFSRINSDLNLDQKEFD